MINVAPPSKRPLPRGWLLAAVGAMVLALFVGVDGFSLDTSMILLRWPRWLAAVMAGATLSLCGYGLQATTQNPLADPFMLGVSGGAAVGAAAATLFASWTAAAGAWSQTPVVVGASIGACAVLMILAVALRRRQTASGERIILLGMCINAIAWSLVALARVVVAPEHGVQMTQWLIGAIGYPSSVVLCAGACGVVVVVLTLWRHQHALGLLRFGHADAWRAGVDVPRVQRAVLIAVSIGVATAMLLGGALTFVGLFIPLWARSVAGAHESRGLLVAGLCGAASVVVADACVRAGFAALGTELPVGVLLAGLAGPMFAVWLWRRP
jgi:iron complex transport system permease protein